MEPDGAAVRAIPEDHTTDREAVAEVHLPPGARVAVDRKARAAPVAGRGLTRRDVMLRCEILNEVDVRRGRRRAAVDRDLGEREDTHVVNGALPSSSLERWILTPLDLDDAARDGLPFASRTLTRMSRKRDWQQSRRLSRTTVSRLNSAPRSMDQEASVASPEAVWEKESRLPSTAYSAGN